MLLTSAPIPKTRVEVVPSGTRATLLHPDFQAIIGWPVQMFEVFPGATDQVLAMVI
ncbi:hypothetical protein [Zoogloea sp. LCSB751]|uniref:hypothetical protein n=1 Tax=Zoogloea sp. LCSB751 TaxID=1965277 RepID=UPI0013747D49|nr:hypothetical protein [Zoogloea sp. LCSB751]